MRQEYKNLQDFIDDIHENLSIKETVLSLGIYAKDDFRGDLVSCCFHDDRTPSLQISDKFFKCYAGSCGVKGDLITFIQLYYNVDFIESINKIAEIYNVNIQNISYYMDSRVSKLKEEWNYYLYQMDKAPKVVQEMQREFFPQEIGYDPKEKYVVLPLTSKTGSILGFTKRRVDALHEKKEDGGFKYPKWKHSSVRNSLITQCHNLFNLYNAANQIRIKNKIILCEGPKDVIAFRRVGLEYCVAVCGTSNSNNAWDLILPVEEIYLAMDGDDTGIKTMINNIQYLTSIHDIKKVFVLQFPENKDPYDIVIEQGKDALLEIYNNPIPALDFIAYHGTSKEMLELYNNTPDYNKIFIINAICKQKLFSVSEAESWLFQQYEPKQHDPLNEKEMLIALIKGEDTKLSMKPDKARRILKIKYGIEM